MIDESRDRAEKFWEETWAAFTETGEMAAYFSALPYTQYFDGQTVPMMGIGRRLLPAPAPPGRSHPPLF